MRELLQEIGALVKGQLTQIVAAKVTRVGEHAAHVETAADRLRDHVTGHGAAHVSGILARHPATLREAFKLHVSPPETKAVFLLGLCAQLYRPRRLAARENSRGDALSI